MHTQEMKNTSHSTDDVSRPDPITGYVWSKSAPSQRRKNVAIDPSYFALQLSSYPDNKASTAGRIVVDSSRLPAFFRSLDRMPVIDTHKVGIMYVAPGQSNEQEILENTHGSPAYTRFLEGIGRLIDLRGQVDVYAGGLDPDEDGEYAYAWWDDIGQILYHTATLMPSGGENSYTNKKRHIGNDYVRIIWNDSGLPYKFDTLSTQFQFVNVVIEPHSRGAIAAYSNNLHENEYFKVTLQKAQGMSEFTPVGEFKLISAEKLPLLVRQLSLLTDWFVDVYQHTKNDTSQVEKVTNWRHRLQAIKRFRTQVAVPTVPEQLEGIMGQESFRDFTTAF
jgi:tuberous sclerosis 2